LPHASNFQHAFDGSLGSGILIN